MSHPSLFGDGDLPEELTVAELNRQAKNAVEGAFGSAVFVRGELVEFKIWRSGHWYFTLRDADASIRCMLWKQQAAGVLKRHGKAPTDGMEVLVRGRPSLWEEKGEYRLTASDIIPTDLLGSKALELERVRAALKADGLLDPDRKRPLPSFARRIAVVTSPDGAALRDMIIVTRKRWPAVELILVGAQVQGDGAVASLVRALGLVNRIDGLDACIVGRGGGAKEDLGAFNAEPVCRALAAVRVPTISAVGHETDVSLSDLVADVRAATPSAAAEIVVPERAALLHRVDGFGIRLGAGLRRRTRVAEERLSRTGDRLQSALGRLIEARRSRVERVAAQLDALSPLRVLARGYSVAQDDTGRVLSRTADFLFWSAIPTPRERRVGAGARGVAPMAKQPTAVPTLQDDLRRLEEIVRRLEADDADLDAALALFEEGVVRLRAARERLAEAEAKVKKVVEQADGSVELVDLDG